MSGHFLLPLLVLLASPPPVATPPSDPVAARAVQGLIVESNGHARATMIVDKKSQTLFIARKVDGSVTVERMPCTTGKVPGDKRREGDLKTPEGIYFFTEYIDGKDLPSLYGVGAFPMDYPNFFDELQGKTGSGIWLHGVESDDRVNIPLDTRGCVAVSNSDFLRLQGLIELLRTPIVIVEDLAREAVTDPVRLRDELMRFLDTWKDSWQRKEMKFYIEHYDRDFRSSIGGPDRWRRHKEDVARQYREIRVGLRGVEILRAGSYARAEFVQEYASENHWDVGTKVLYLRHGAHGWKIVREDWRELPGEALVAIRQPVAPPPPVTIASRLATGGPVADAGRTGPAARPQTPPPAPEPAETAARGAPRPAATATVAAAPPAEGQPAGPEPAGPAAIASVALSPARPAQAKGTPAALPETGTRPTGETAQRVPVPGARLAIERFSWRREDGRLRVSFWLRNLAGPSRPATGFLSIVARDAAGNVIGMMPQGAPLENGVPTSFRAGEWYSARHFRATEADLVLGAGEASRVEVFAWDSAGALVHREELGL